MLQNGVWIVRRCMPVDVHILSDSVRHGTSQSLAGRQTSESCVPLQASVSSTTLLYLRQPVARANLGDNGIWATLARACNKFGLASRGHPHLQRLQSSCYPAQYQARAALAVCDPLGLLSACAPAWPDAALHPALRALSVNTVTRPQHAVHRTVSDSRSTPHLTA